MIKIFIFSGTTEGRLLSEYLCENKIENTVFVATDYGQVVMTEHSLCHIMQGRLTCEDMALLFAKEKPDIVVDATHPFAVEVSDNIKKACQASDLGAAYIRLSRSIEDMSEGASIKVVKTTDEAITFLKNTSGNILLTTGVKTLPEYAICPKLKDRLFARILPSMESFQKAVATGLDRRQIIAMEGPFTDKMNEATIDQYDIDILVTKNSGIRGGIKEKLSACKARGIQAVVIDLDDKYKNDGYSLNQVKDLVYKKATGREDVSKTISIVGIGMGNDASVTVAGRQCIESADLIIGARRMLEYGATINSSAGQVAEYMPEALLEIIKAAPEKNIAVLMSGDTGFYSGADKLCAILDKNDIAYRLCPGLSSISYFCSLIGKSYSSYPLLSAHGKKLVIDESIRQQAGFFAILSGAEDIDDILFQLQDYPKTCVYVGYNLGQDSQRIDCFYVGEAHSYNKKGLYVIGVFQDED